MKNKRLKIAIITGVWLRHDVFEMFAKGIKHLEKNIKGAELVTIVAGSEGNKSKELVEKHGFHYINIPNQPLAAKMQSTMFMARDIDADYVLCVGSDDIIGLGLMERYIELMHKGVDYFGTVDFYFYNVVSKRASYWGGYREDYRKGHLCGAGRCLSKQLLKKMDWLVWTNEYSHLLDTSMQRRLKLAQPYTTELINLKNEGLYGLDIKSEINMTPFELWDNTVIIDSEIIEGHFNYIFP